MVIRGRAPLRVSFGGGGTDVAPFCEEQGGAIIGSTINKYAYCSIVPREDDQIVVHSLDFDMTVKYNTIPAALESPRKLSPPKLLRELVIKRTLDIWG